MIFNSFIQKRKRLHTRIPHLEGGQKGKGLRPEGTKCHTPVVWGEMDCPQGTKGL